ncbi:MAG TPA: flagellin [Bacillota bacterium]
MRIVNNISAMNTHRQLGITDRAMGKTLEKLSSGLRINRAGDDAAGLAISEKMRGQIGSMKMAVRNAEDGISLIQTAEGALNEVHAMLHRMRELAIQAKNGTLEDSDMDELQKEYQHLNDEISRIFTVTKFNGKDLIKIGDGTGSGTSFGFQIGAAAGDALNVTIKELDKSNLSGTSIGAGGTDLAEVLQYIDDFTKAVTSLRNDLGAFQNRMEHTINNLGVSIENLSAAESRIRDADMAQEMTNFTKHQILTQSATAMLAQANMRPQSVLQLLG